MASTEEINMTIPTEKPVDVLGCTYCSRELNDDERDSPSHDNDGDVLCDDCYDEHYRDYCGRCDELVDKTDLDRSPGQLIGIWSDDSGLPAGYYRVTSWPFFANGMIEAHFFKHALEFTLPLDEQGMTRAEDGGYMAGPLCSNCRVALARIGGSA